MDPNVSSEFDSDFTQNFDPDFQARFRELDRQSAQLPKLLFSIFLAIAVPLLIIAGLSTWMT